MNYLTKIMGIFALSGFALAPAVPAFAQDAQDAAVSNEDTEAAYAMTMMCLEATMSMAIKADQAGDAPTYEQMTSEGALWLEVANTFAKDLGRSADADMDVSVARMLAEGNLLGDDVAFARQKIVFDECSKIINSTTE